MADATEAVLQAVPDTVTAIPFQPGLGKSTLIRALLAVMAQEFQDRTSIARAIGGVIVVVEKTAEAEELETLCNTQRAERPVAKAVFSPNDYNLALRRCINGTAQSYSECPGRSCRDYAHCPLVQSARQTHSTPILIISHARYQHHMENMSALLPWEDESGQYIRTLLLVDELPQLTEDNVMNLRTINQFESMFDQLKPSYQVQLRKAKSTLLYLWHDAIRSPFFRLLHSAPEHCSLFGTVSQQELKTAGFTEDRLQKLRNAIVNYTGTEDCGSVHLVDALLTAKAAYYAVGQDTSFFFPRLKALHGGTLRLDSMPSVMGMQDITLAREIVQMVFRSALRNHGGTEPIELWLLQPPNGVIRYLQSYFVDGQIQEISEPPTECQLAMAKGKTYMGEQTHAAKVLEFLVNLPLGRRVTPEQIREATGLTRISSKKRGNTRRSVPTLRSIYRP